MCLPPIFFYFFPSICMFSNRPTPTEKDLALDKDIDNLVKRNLDSPKSAPLMIEGRKCGAQNKRAVAKASLLGRPLDLTLCEASAHISRSPTGRTDDPKKYPEPELPSRQCRDLPANPVDQLSLASDFHLLLPFQQNTKQSNHRYTLTFIPPFRRIN